MAKFCKIAEFSDRKNLSVNYIQIWLQTNGFKIYSHKKFCNFLFIQGNFIRLFVTTEAPNFTTRDFPVFLLNFCHARILSG